MGWEGGHPRGYGRYRRVVPLQHLKGGFPLRQGRPSACRGGSVAKCDRRLGANDCALERRHSETRRCASPARGRQAPAGCRIPDAVVVVIVARCLGWQQRHRQKRQDHSIPRSGSNESLLEHIDGVLLSSMEPRVAASTATPAATAPIVAVVVALVVVVLRRAAAVVVPPLLRRPGRWVVV